MRTLVRIGLRNVLRNRRRSLVTLAALAVGVAAMLIVHGCLSGLHRTLKRTVTQGITGAIQVHRRGTGTLAVARPPLPAALLSVVRDTPGVQAASGRLDFFAMLSHAERSLFAEIIAVDPRTELSVCGEEAQLLYPGGRFVGAEGADGTVMTPAMATALGLGHGDEAGVLVENDDGLAAEAIHLSGTIALNSGGEERFVLMPLALAQQLMHLAGQLTEIVVAVEPLEQAPAVAEALRAALGDDYEVLVWTEVARSVQIDLHNGTIEAKVAEACFLILMLLGVSNTMLMSIVERTREIGTMMALGMRRRRIVAMLLCEAAGIGCLGALAGAAVGGTAVLALGAHGIVVATLALPMPFVVRPFIEPGALAQAVGLATAGAMLACLYPALRAARLRPVQALGMAR